MTNNVTSKNEQVDLDISLMWEKYADLLVRTGIHLRKGQTLVVSVPIECAEFARLIMKCAYETGAHDVILVWEDEKAARLRLMLGPDELFDTYPEWRQRLYIKQSEQGAAFLTISASDPELMKDVPVDRLKRNRYAAGMALKPYSDRAMSNKNAWCVAAVPTAAWAKKVYPHLEPELAVEALWKAILKAVRVDENEPVEAWQAHLDALRRRYRTLNDYNFLKLKFISGLGTDLEVALPKGHMWLGGADEMDDGHFFVANMPTEEIFTLPKRDAVNGIVVASMPLNLNGTLIEDFRIRFENGKVVEFSAAQGETALKSFLETDEGASYLGEVALVAASSPIARTGHLFYNTLFDENAACHLALGKAYPVCLKNYDEYSKDELDQIGFNQSLVHMDFMFGTPDMKVTGITQDGLSVEIMRDGEFVI